MALPQVIKYIKNWTKTRNVLPITIERAVFDDEGNRLDNKLLHLENKGLYIDEYEEDEPFEPNIQAIDADTLGGKPPEYYDNSFDITELKMLGWNVPKEFSVQNVIIDKQFVQNVGRIKLGDLTWTENTSYGFYSNDIEGIKRVPDVNTKANIYTEKFTTSTQNIVMSSKGQNTIALVQNTDVLVVSTLEASSAFADYYLYYELATPIVINIDGNEAIQAVKDLKEYRLHTIAQSEFQRFTIQTGQEWANYISRTGAVKMLMLDGYLNYSETAIIYVLPEEYRPSRTIRRGIHILGGSSDYSYAQISTNGSVYINASANARIMDCITFI